VSDVDIISLDESQGHVNNSPFVNAIVQQALLTPAYIYSLENKTTVDFHYFADNMNIALEDNVYHPAYDGFHLRQSLSLSLSPSPFLSLSVCLSVSLSLINPVLAPGCKNRPAPFPCRML